MTENSIHNDSLSEFIRDNKNFINFIKDLFSYKLSMLFIIILTIILTFVSSQLIAKTTYKYSQDILVSSSAEKTEFVNSITTLKKYSMFFQINDEIQLGELIKINNTLSNESSLEQLFLNLRNWTYIQLTIAKIKEEYNEDLNNMGIINIEEILSSLINIEYKTIDGVKTNLINFHMTCDESIHNLCKIFILNHIKNTVNLTNDKFTSNYKAAIKRVNKNSKDSLNLKDLEYKLDFLEKKNELESIISLKEMSMQMAKRMGVVEPSELVGHMLDRYKGKGTYENDEYLKGSDWLGEEIIQIRKSLDNIEDYDLVLSEKKIGLESSKMKHKEFLAYLNTNLDIEIELGYEAQRLEKEIAGPSYYKTFFIGLFLGIIFSFFISLIRLIKRSKVK